MRAVFGDFVLDFDTRELSRSAEAVHLSAKAFQLLEVLVRSAPSAVSKDDVYNALWGSSFVAEANISNLASEVRAALGDDSHAPRYLKTVHRFGYRFTEPVRWDARGPALAVRSWLTWGGRDIALSDGEHLIGRDATAAVLLAVAGVSRRHAMLRVGGDQIIVTDLESKNGTFVNGSRVAGSVSLHDGDTIQLGSVALVFHACEDHETTLTRDHLHAEQRPFEQLRVPLPPTASRSDSKQSG